MLMHKIPNVQPGAPRCSGHIASRATHSTKSVLRDRVKQCSSGNSTNDSSSCSCSTSSSSSRTGRGIRQTQPQGVQTVQQGENLDISRRALVSGAAGSAFWLNSQLPAWALRTIELRDGTKADVYEHGMTLEIVALRGSIPQQWIIDFRQGLGKYAGFQLGQRKQLQELFDELGKPQEKRSAGAADVVTLGDSWMAAAIRQRLLQPIASAETYRWWRRLPRRWQQLVRRDPTSGLLSEHGPIWGCPYRWGGMLLAYKRDLLLRPRLKSRPIKTWADLLQPALKGRIAFPDNPREFLGIAFKTLGHPLIGFNATRADLEAAGIDPEDVRTRVRQLRSQARLFSSQEHVRALMTGDVWVCIGSSTDLVPVSERMSTVDLIAPADGTNLWADVWVVPANAQHGHLQSGPSPILPSWLEFSVSPARADILNGLKDGASPILLPFSVEEHATIAAAAAAAAPASSSTTSSQSSGSSWGWKGRGGKKQQQEEQQRQQHLLEQQQQLAQQQQLLYQKQQELYDAAVCIDDAELKLEKANQFMPPDSVLELSEFMLPLDSQTLDFYQWLLA